MIFPFPNQYKQDIFTKLKFPFKPGKKLLDVGCGDGSDAGIFLDYYRLNVWGTDVYQDSRLTDVPKIKFKLGGIFHLPYPAGSFDYVFLHDVLHHIDEPDQSPARHLRGLQELKRVCKKRGYIIILEGNRYNPLFYPHMVKSRGHDHFTQKYFIRLVKSVFPQAQFRHFEAHLYPQFLLPVFRVYEWLMERLPTPRFLAYNIAIIKNG